jgi:chromosomal replication initiation ATPase DnaA
VDQLTFDLSRGPAQDRSSFLISDSNAAAVGWIDRWPAWPSSLLVLCGPRESGKTHLARLWCERAAAVRVAGPSLQPAALSRLFTGNISRIAVDDADRSPETALLHLCNRCQEEGGYLLATSREPPGSWEIGLADLRSRLRAAITARIEMPDDELLGAVLVKHFADRQLRIGPELIAYLVRRIDRSFAAAAAIVAALDAAALATHRPIAIPLARQLLRAAAPSTTGEGLPGHRPGPRVHASHGPRTSSARGP